MRASPVFALLHILALVLAGCQAPPAPQPDTTDRAPAPAGMNSPQTTDTSDGRSLDVRLEAVSGERPRTSDEPRNPFRFGSAMPVVEQDTPDGALTPGPFDEPAGGTPTAGSPQAGGDAPAPLKFIGVVDAPESAGLVAVLTDGAFVFHGRENEIIEGRYRIVRINAMSIEIEFLQGGGRQTIRLSGS